MPVLVLDIYSLISDISTSKFHRNNTRLEKLSLMLETTQLRTTKDKA